ncbi:adenylate/guanylate cyclase domain-containing protein [Phycisphaerales bacterium AB-hyl4]|uniref:Adenylate/guanylate cyclase domain-containing protein n=1 Tax=Natronomicrosphaera hydrolytica TaxID=3242702 RepID=A0ABV4U3C7_9BACT
MSWNEQDVRERVARNDFSDFEVNVADLTRTIEFENLGTKDVRRAAGAHLYSDVPNFHLAVQEAGDDKAKLKKVIRAASVLRKVQGELAEAYEIGQMQRQAARFHALCFKPYDDEAERAKQAVCFGITLNSYLHDVFNEVFSDVRNLTGSVGIAAGMSYIANIGQRGERERIALGSCANLAAKVLDKGDTINVTKEVYDALPNCLQEHFSRMGTVAGVPRYQAHGLRWNRQKELAEELGVRFDADRLRSQTEEHRDALRLDDMQLTEASVPIDLELLTERNSKHTSAVAIYADLDGFTKYVQDAEQTETVVSLVRIFHMIRAEFHAVLKSDFPGLVLQHQGDRVLASIHMPNGDQIDKRCQTAVDAAIGLQSSMEQVLNERLGNRELHVAVGLDVGKTLITRLGKKGRRQAICLGSKVHHAEKLQLRSGPQQIRITGNIYNTLNDEVLAKQFHQVNDDEYVATGLTFLKLDELAEEHAARAGSLGSVVVQGHVQCDPHASRSQRPWATMTEQDLMKSAYARPWFVQNATRWTIEQEHAHQLMDNVHVSTTPDHRGQIEGSFALRSHHGHIYDVFRIRLIYPPRFPYDGQVPKVYLDSHRNRWVRTIDGHIQDDWGLCLFVPGDSDIDFSQADAFCKLLGAIHEFLIKERIYQRDLVRWEVLGIPPKWPGDERPHGVQGIAEVVRERGGIDGGEPCTCGSGRKFKHCHGPILKGNHAS